MWRETMALVAVVLGVVSSAGVAAARPAPAWCRAVPSDRGMDSMEQALASEGVVEGVWENAKSPRPLALLGVPVK